MKIKVCLHNHTFRSKYSINTEEDFAQAFDEGRIDKVAITDHNYLQEAKNLQRKFGDKRIILGEEITTKEGEVIGLFLKRFVPSGTSLQRTCEHIKAQGGVVCVPHPFSGKRNDGIGEEGLEKIKSYIDVIEIYNGWTHRSLKRLDRRFSVS